MPAASCRIMPARSIRRCDTISASFGFSLRMVRKNRDNRMGTLKESVKHGRSAVKPDRARKHKGAYQPRPLRRRISCGFAGDLFFFQAEDGIRDWSVTGVQTCALPI